MVREKTNLTNEYNIYYCYERGCCWGDIMGCVLNGPCAVYGGECPKKEPLTRLCDFFDEFEETKPIIKEIKQKQSIFKRLFK